MKGITLVLFCALALAKAEPVRFRRDTNAPDRSDPKQARTICASALSEGTLIAHEHCNQFYKCNHGNPIAFSCHGDLRFNTNSYVCDWPQDVDCGTRTLPENEGHVHEATPEEAATICAAEGSRDLQLAHTKCNRFYKCQDGKPITFKCPGDLRYNSIEGYCDCADNVICAEKQDPENGSGDSSENGNTGSGNDNPNLAPEICAADDSSGILVAHENCNKFYKCTHGKPVEFRCYGNLMFNPAKDHCDWPENVDCGDRIIPEDCDEDNNENENSHENGGDNDGGNGNGGGGGEEDGGGGGGSGICNCNPGEAPQICAADGSDGAFVAHDNCNQFFVCTGGRPVVQTCPTGLLYNPYIQRCDWAHEVECGDRVIPEDCEDNNENENSHENGGDNDSGNGNGSGGGGEDGSGGGGNGICNCNPGEAPQICAADGSDGAFVAHDNCNQFFVCTGGRPVVQTCPSGLLYNPYIQRCDWPHQVECGDRVIPEDCEDNNENDNSHENGGDNDGGNGNGGGGGGEDGGGGGGNGICNCNPGEAPQICAADGSDGAFVAHDNCNQFFVCTGGRPVVQTCPTGLLYNPYIQRCDWAHEVECGDRVIPEDCEDNNENDNSHENGGDNDGGNGNGGGGGGEDGSGGGGNGICNCNPGEAPQICEADGSDGAFVAHDNCNQFFVCTGGRPVVQTCPAGLLYNPYIQRCDWPHQVECGDRVIPEDSEDNNENDNSHENGGDNDGGNGNGGGGGGEDGGGGGGSGICNCNPGEAPQICAADGSDGAFVAHDNCNQFFVCTGGRPVVQTCPTGLLYNPYIQRCDWAHEVECGDRVIPEDCEDNNENDNSHENEGDNDGGNGNGGGGGGEDGGGGGGNGICNCNPGEAPQICAADGSDGAFVAHDNCNQFFVCAGGRPVVQTCPSGLLYNPYIQRCDWPHQVECGDRVIPEDSEDNNENENSHENGGDNDGGNGNGGGGGGEDGGGGGGSGICNCNPGEAPQICAADGSDGAFVAHDNCNQFFVCTGGRPVVQTCPTGLLYNPYIQRCDWAHEVECGDRVIPEDCEDNNENDNSHENEGDNDGGNGNGGGGGGEDGGGGGGNGICNCNPGEAPQICAADGSDGAFVAHDNCNQFFVCTGGRPVVQTCPSGLLYNPYIQRCDWPHQVECGDRVIPEDCEDNNENDNSHENGGDNDGGNGNGGGGGGEDGGGGGGSGICNCNPGEAPQICAADGSDGAFVAHDNCNQFFVCTGGRPVVQTCPTGLLYNPYIQRCDWAHEVECGDRVIPEDCEDNNENENSHENGGDNDGGNGNGGGGGGEDGGGGGGNGICNCNPGEAPQICAADGSDGAFVAHDNCNQFFVCTGGRPVVQTCPSGLLYNPYIQRCDWPHQVECGDRVIPEDCEDNNENDNSHENGGDNDGGNGNGGGGGGEDGGGGGGNGICNCNPGEAPQICAADGSDGAFVAHDNCNQFFVCTGGRPVVQTCPTGLLYNPYIQRCDWAHEVECGDRVIPEDCEDNNENENSHENGGDNDGGNGNGGGGGGEEGGGGGGNGICNCNPGEAPQICAADGSDGAFVAHDNCNQFFVCTGGRPVVQTCPSGLLYNPYIQRCDWPHQVECGDRVIPEDCEDNNENENSYENGGDNDGGNGNGGGGGGEDGGGGDGNGICNCNPGEAPQICAADGSDGAFVVHDNCNQFFVCTGGRPVVQTCPTGLLYNPYIERCDWAQEVECGERVIPEDCDDTNENESTTENGGGGGTCNCNPGEALQICSGTGSDGVLVAHDNCHQFYICNGGHPVVETCPSGLLYNPYEEKCDWPDKVDCGNRTITEVECEDEDNNEHTDEKDNQDNGEDDGNGSFVTPEQAESICSKDSSVGIFLPHRNCNQFFTCVGDRPVVLTCFGDLLYNGHKEACDWPELVDCQDRVRPGSVEPNGVDGNEKQPEEEEVNESQEQKEEADETEVEASPSYAAAVVACAATNSAGLAMPHEQCNRFYMCLQNIPTLLQCNSDLLFDTSRRQCNFPERVDCGDRSRALFTSFNKHLEGRQALNNH